MGIAGGPTMKFSWESGEANKLALAFPGPEGQSQQQTASYSVAGDTLTFTPAGAPEKLVFKRSRGQTASQHPDHLAHSWTSEPTFSNGLKQTVTLDETGTLTLTPENGKPLQGTWKVAGDQLTLTYPDAASGESQTSVFQMTLGGQAEEGSNTPITVDLYLKGVGENKASLMYTRPLAPSGRNREAVKFPSGAKNNQQEPSSQSRAALEKLVAEIVESEHGEVVEVSLDETQITNAGLVHLEG